MLLMHLAMSTPHEEIERFLAARGTDPATDPDDALAVAREFARCMCDELRDALAQWEFETASLCDGRFDPLPGERG
jgi:hypothetical protein